MDVEVTEAISSNEVWNFHLVKSHHLVFLLPVLLALFIYLFIKFIFALTFKGQFENVHFFFQVAQDSSHLNSYMWIKSHLLPGKVFISSSLPLAPHNTRNWTQYFVIDKQALYHWTTSVTLDPWHLERSCVSQVSTSNVLSYDRCGNQLSPAIPKQAHCFFLFLCFQASPGTLNFFDKFVT